MLKKVALVYLVLPTLLFSQMAGTCFADPSVLLKQADAYKHNRSYEQAEAIYLGVIANYPGSNAALKAQKDLIAVYISAKKNGEAQAALNKLIADFSANPDLPAALCDVATRYQFFTSTGQRQWSDRYEAVKTIYQYLKQRYPNSSYAAQIRLDVPRYQILSYAKAGDYSKTIAAIDSLIADFSGNSDLLCVVSLAAEEYCLKGSQLEAKGLSSQARDCSQKAAAIFEMVISGFSDPVWTPRACCWAGDCYNKLGEYGRSIDCYQKTVDDYPGYSLAGHALFMVGRNYESMEKSGLISKSEADLKIRAVYEQLLEKYPACKMAKYVRHWLSRHKSK